MERKSIKCLLLKSIGYDKKFKTLEIEFHDKGIRKYSNVPEKVHEDLMSTARKRLYFFDNIKGKYKYILVKPSIWQSKPSFYKYI